MTLAQFLTARRLTEGAFALSLGVSQPTIHRYVHGKRFPDREMILRIEIATDGAVTVADWYSSPAAVPTTTEGAAA